MGGDGEVIAPSTFRWVRIQYLGPPRVKGIEDSDSEWEDDQKRQDETRKDLILIAQKAM